MVPRPAVGGDAPSEGFPPVVDSRAQVLILGSFPSAKSLAQGQYYAHPQNQFWKLLSLVLHRELTAMNYAERLAVLREHRIALWDVIGRCTRAGSLDSSIRSAQHNDFSRVLAVASRLDRVCFNGKTSGRLEPLFRQWGYATLVLPSSSPAYT